MIGDVELQEVMKYTGLCTNLSHTTEDVYSLTSRHQLEPTGSLCWHFLLVDEADAVVLSGVHLHDVSYPANVAGNWKGESSHDMRQRFTCTGFKCSIFVLAGPE